MPHAPTLIARQAHTVSTAWDCPERLFLHATAVCAIHLQFIVSARAPGPGACLLPASLADRGSL